MRFEHRGWPLPAGGLLRGDRRVLSSIIIDFRLYLATLAVTSTTRLPTPSSGPRVFGGGMESSTLRWNSQRPNFRVCSGEHFSSRSFTRPPGNTAGKTEIVNILVVESSLRVSHRTVTVLLANQELHVLKRIRRDHSPISSITYSPHGF